MENIYVQNRSTMLTGAQVEPVIEAINKQLENHFCPVYGLDAMLTTNSITGPQDWTILLLDDSDQAGALGYHDLTKSDAPVSKIFVKDDMKYNLQWSVTLSHEVLEMLADPFINLVVMKDWNTLYSYEVCDACEDSQFAYKINDVLVSDFVTPAWFDPQAAGSGKKFDFGNHISQPFELLSGGYIGVYDMLTKQWSQKTYGMKRPSVGHRSMMRQLKAAVRGA